MRTHQRSEQRRQRLTPWAFCLIGMMMGGCPGNGSGTGGSGFDGSTVAGPPKLLPFKSADDWIGFFREQARQRLVQRGGRGYFATAGGGGAVNDLAAPSVGAAEGDSAGGEPFSTTNVQEAGVDEGDVVKSDGTNLYIAKYRSLRIVRANPRTELAEIGRFDTDDPITAMYLIGDKVLVISQRFGATDGYAVSLIWPPYVTGGTTVIREISVADPSQPVETAKVELDGSLVSSRVTGGRLIAVLSIVPKLPAEVTNRRLNALTMADVMPQVRDSGGSRDLVPWDRWLYPATPDGFLMTAVVTLDAGDIEATLGTVAVLAQAGTIYSSTEALYVTDTDYDLDGAGRVTTAIHKFAFDDNGVAQYVASGSAPGRLLNQFSLGEHNGALRVATHIEPGFWRGLGVGGIEPAAVDVARSQQNGAPPQPSNAVYVLTQSGESLEIAGRIENIAPGERLYAARFLGKRGFLVTFKQIDPLFALDLSDPAMPKIVGELKIPGFSDYLHPIGETHLLGVGRATTDTPWGGTVPTSTQLSLFDVSDPANPTLVQQFSIGGYGSTSDANYDHKAFAYLAESRLLAIPATTWPQGYDPIHNNYLVYVPPDFEGVLCYRVEPATGFTLLGKVASIASPDPYSFGYYGGWKRPAFIGETVYAINELGVRAAPLSDFDATTQVRLAPGDERYDGYEDAGGGAQPSSGRGR